MSTAPNMNNQEQKNIIEAALFVASEPLSVEKLRALFEGDANQLSKADIQECIDELKAEYNDNHGIYLQEVASGYRFQTRENTALYLHRLLEKKPARHSRAFLETLALIAYRQPISRGEIEAVRGVPVNSDMMRKLLEQDWIRMVGRRDVPGKPALFGTTQKFLDDFNLKKLDDLPPLKVILDFENMDSLISQQISLPIES